MNSKTLIVSEEPKKPVIFTSISHAGEMVAILRVAKEYALNHPDQDVVVLSTDEAKKSFETASSGIPNLSFRSYGEYSTLSAEFTEKVTEAHRNAPSPYAAFQFPLELDKKIPYRATFDNLVSIFKEINPCLAVVDYVSRVQFDVCRYLEIQYVILMPSYVSGAFNDDYAASALSVGHYFSGTNARNPTIGSVLTSIWHRNTFILYAVYLIISRGMLRDRMAAAKELKFDFVQDDPHTYARAVVAACNWGIEFPVRLRPNAFLVGPIIETVKKTSTASANDAELFDWINEDSRNFIFISLGTLSQFSNSEILAFIEELSIVFRGQNVRVLWKFHKSAHEFINEVLRAKSISTDDFKIVSWIHDILGVLHHPKVAVNINHAGGNSFNEALYFGVPQLWIPLWVDCYDIAVRGEVAEIGLNVNCKKSFKGISPALKKILTDDKFKINAMFWSEKAKVAGGLKRAVEVIEDVVEEVAIEEKYGVNHQTMLLQTNKVITDPGFVGLLFFAIKVLVYALFLGIGIIIGWRRMGQTSSILSDENVEHANPSITSDNSILNFNFSPLTRPSVIPSPSSPAPQSSSSVNLSQHSTQNSSEPLVNIMQSSPNAVSAAANQRRRVARLNVPRTSANINSRRYSSLPNPASHHRRSDRVLMRVLRLGRNGRYGGRPSELVSGNTSDETSDSSPETPSSENDVFDHTPSPPAPSITPRNTGANHIPLPSSRFGSSQNNVHGAQLASYLQQGLNTANAPGFFRIISSRNFLGNSQNANTGSSPLFIVGIRPLPSSGNGNSTGSPPRAPSLQDLNSLVSSFTSALNGQSTEPVANPTDSSNVELQSSDTGSGSSSSSSSSDISSSTPSAPIITPSPSSTYSIFRNFFSPAQTSSPISSNPATASNTGLSASVPSSIFNVIRPILPTTNANLPSNSPSRSRQPELRERWMLYIIAFPGPIGNNPTDAASSFSQNQSGTTLNEDSTSTTPAASPSTDGSAPTNTSQESPEQDELSDILARLIRVLFSAMLPNSGETEAGLDGYEQLLRLAELVGSARPRNIRNREQLESQVPIVVYNQAQVEEELSKIEFEGIAERGGEEDSRDGDKEDIVEENFGSNKKRKRVESKEETKGKQKVVEISRKRARLEAVNFEGTLEEKQKQVGAQLIALSLGGTRERCSICLGDYADGDELRMLTCRHAFHKNCFDEWVVDYVNSCPICRVKCVDEKTQAAGAGSSSGQTREGRRPNIFLRVQLDRGILNGGTSSGGSTNSQNQPGVSRASPVQNDNAQTNSGSMWTFSRWFGSDSRNQ
ncbi:hypothetical protein HK098_004297 [Nowakowskiella sp. JEL0407]|nr:hypothetical protein HK098_004297 [Nowakowskiella sp. JEL0407]